MNNKLTDMQKQALRVNAIRAGGGKWCYVRSSLHSRGYITDEKGSTVINCTDGDVPANCAGFLESAHPAVVLLLLDELAAKDAVIQEYWKAPAVPDGYALMPVEPTSETLAAMLEANDSDQSMYSVYKAVVEQPPVDLQEYRKAVSLELKPANLINKFYERYPLANFKSDSERAEALGYFMAGAELQCYGDFIAYEGGNSDE